jgi:hypothetical protein
MDRLKSLTKYPKRLLKWRKYRKTVVEIWVLLKLAVEANADGVVTEEEAQELGTRLVSLGYGIKDLL